MGYFWYTNFWVPDPPLLYSNTPLPLPPSPPQGVAARVCLCMATLAGHSSSGRSSPGNGSGEQYKMMGVGPLWCCAMPMRVVSAQHATSAIIAPPPPPPKFEWGSNLGPAMLEPRVLPLKHGAPHPTYGPTNTQLSCYAA